MEKRKEKITTISISFNNWLGIIGTVLVIIVIMLLLTVSTYAYEEKITEKEYAITIDITNNTLKINTTEENYHDGSYGIPFHNTYTIEHETLIINISDCDSSDLATKIDNCISNTPNNETINSIFKRRFDEDRSEMLQNFKTEIVNPLKDINECKDELSACKIELSELQGKEVTQISEVQNMRKVNEECNKNCDSWKWITYASLLITLLSLAWASGFLQQIFARKGNYNG